MISFEDFSKLELKVGTVLEAEDVEGSEKLIKLVVDLGEEKPKQILAGIKKWYKDPLRSRSKISIALARGTLPFSDEKGKPATFSRLVGKQFVFVANLEPKVMMGLESNGMLLATDTEKPVPIKPSFKVPAGSKLR